MSEWHATDLDLVQSIDRELAPQRRELLDRHVVACAVCAARLAQLRSALDDVDVALPTDSSVTHPASRSGRIRLVAAMSAAESQPSGRLTRPIPDVLLQASLAAAVVGLLFVLPGLRLTHPSDQDASRPNTSLTPGAVSTLSAAQLCEGERPSRFVSVASRSAVLNSYRMTEVASHLFELDALVTPELGGTTDAANLWPQRFDSPVWNAKVKDQIERLLPQLVCRGELTLQEAQQAIAADWIGTYRTFFKTDRPIHNVAELAMDDDDELVFEAEVKRLSHRWPTPVRPPGRLPPEIAGWRVSPRYRSPT